MARTRKQPYRKSRAIDQTCRSHGGCPWCLGNRMWKHLKRLFSAQDQLEGEEVWRTGYFGWD